MNSNGDYPYRHKDVRDRRRLLQRLGFGQEKKEAENKKITKETPRGLKVKSTETKQPLKRSYDDYTIQQGKTTKKTPRSALKKPSNTSQTTSKEKNDPHGSFPHLLLPKRRIRRKEKEGRKKSKSGRAITHSSASGSSSVSSTSSLSSSSSSSLPRNESRKRRKHHRQKNRKHRLRENKQTEEEEEEEEEGKHRYSKSGDDKSPVDAYKEQFGTKEGFIIAQLTMLLRLRPFKWVPFLHSVLTLTNGETVLTDHIMRIARHNNIVEEDKDDKTFRNTVIPPSLESLATFYPDDQCLYPIYIAQCREKAVFATVMSDIQPRKNRTHTSIFSDDSDRKKSRKKMERGEANTGFSLYQGHESSIVSPGTRVFISPFNYSKFHLPNLGGIRVPYQLPARRKEMDNVALQQPVVRGLTRDTKLSTGNIYLASIQVPSPTPSFSDIPQTVTNKKGSVAPKHPLVPACVPMEPLRTFIHALEVSSLETIRHTYQSLRQSLRIPYFVTDTQFIERWHTHNPTVLSGYMFPRHLLEKAFRAKQKVFDDLYIIWYILFHGPTKDTETFIVDIYTTIEAGLCAPELPLSIRPPHLYIEDLLNHLPDPLLERWYTVHLYPKLQPYLEPTSVGENEDYTHDSSTEMMIYNPSTPVDDEGPTTPPISMYPDVQNTKVAPYDAHTTSSSSSLSSSSMNENNNMSCNNGGDDENNNSSAMTAPTVTPIPVSPQGSAYTQKGYMSNTTCEYSPHHYRPRQTLEGGVTPESDEEGKIPYSPSSPQYRPESPDEKHVDTTASSITQSHTGDRPLYSPSHPDIPDNGTCDELYSPSSPQYPPTSPTPQQPNPIQKEENEKESRNDGRETPPYARKDTITFEVSDSYASSPVTVSQRLALASEDHIVSSSSSSSSSSLPSDFFSSSSSSAGRQFTTVPPTQTSVTTTEKKGKKVSRKKSNITGQKKNNLSTLHKRKKNTK
jgi:hypothetical protein